MKTNARNASTTIALISALLLSACGGGGGASGTVQASSAITSANSADVAANTFSSIMVLNGEAADGTTLIFSSSTDTSGGATSKGIIGITLQQIYKGLAAKSAGSVSIAATTTQQRNCSYGGTMTTIVTEAASGIVSNGDSMTITASNCVQGPTTLNGSITVSFSNVSGTPSPSSAWSATLSLTYSNFTISDGLDSIRAHGDMTNAVNQVNANNISYVASGTSFASTRTSGTTTMSETLSGYRYDGFSISGVDTYGANFTTSGTFPALGAVTYSVVTTVPFKQTAGKYPYQGSMTVKATNDSSLKMNVIDNFSVQIEIDKNGDGIYEEARTMSWSALENLL